MTDLLHTGVTPQHHTYTSADGLTLHYVVYEGGDETPAVCLHGLSRNARDFSGLALHLSKDRPVVCPDFRGRGDSQWDPDPSRYNAEVYVGDILKLLDRLKLDRVLLIGTSLGGIVSAGICQVALDRVAGVVLNDIGPVIDPAGLARIASYVGKGSGWASWDEAIAAIQEKSGDIYPDFTDEQWLEFVRQICRLRDDGLVVEDYDPAISQAFAADQVADLDLWPLFDVLKPVPVLLIRGGLSDLLSAATAQEMTQRLPSLDLVTIENRGHVPTLTELQALSAIEAFARKVDTQGSSANN